MLLCFAAVVLSAACVFFAQDMRLRIALIALCGIFAVMGAVALNRVIHPRTHAQKEEKRLRREAFLEKHLGFREDPEDEEAQERAREKELERRRRMLRAEEKDRQVELDAGDMEIQGKLMGRTRVATDAGDIEIDTPLARAEYALKLRTDAGDLEVKEAGRSAEEYEGGYKLEEYGGPHKLNVRTFSGDVEVHFGN